MPCWPGCVKAGRAPAERVGQMHTRRMCASPNAGPTHDRRSKRHSFCVGVTDWAVLPGRPGPVAPRRRARAQASTLTGGGSARCALRARLPPAAGPAGASRSRGRQHGLALGRGQREQRRLARLDKGRASGLAQGRRPGLAGRGAARLTGLARPSAVVVQQRRRRHRSPPRWDCHCILRGSIA